MTSEPRNPKSEPLPVGTIIEYDGVNGEIVAVLFNGVYMIKWDDTEPDVPSSPSFVHNECTIK